MTLHPHDEYSAAVTPEACTLLEQVPRKVAEVVPDATPCISYKMPAFKHQRVFFYFAAFKHHLGIYPPVTDDAALIDELAPYRGPKGNLSFAYRDPLPVELIGRVAMALAREYAPKS